MSNDRYEDENGGQWKVEDSPTYPSETILTTPGGQRHELTENDCNQLFWMFLGRLKKWESDEPTTEVSHAT